MIKVTMRTNELNLLKKKKTKQKNQLNVYSE